MPIDAFVRMGWTNHHQFSIVSTVDHDALDPFGVLQLRSTQEDLIGTDRYGMLSTVDSQRTCEVVQISIGKITFDGSPQFIQLFD